MSDPRDIFKYKNTDTPWQHILAKGILSRTECNEFVKIFKMIDWSTAEKNTDIEMATLYFYTSMLYFQKEDYKNAGEGFDKAETYFKKVYKGDHYVFGIIKEAREKMKGK